MAAVSRRSVRVAAPIIAIALLVAGWELVAYTQRTVLPKLEDVVVSLFTVPTMYLQAIGATVANTLIGFAIGVVVALVLAGLIAYFDWLRAAIMPIATMLHVTPIVAIAPALIVAFGFGAVPHIMVSAISAFFPMLVNAIAGFAATDPQAEEVFGAMSASRWETFSKLQLPSSLGFLFAGGQVAITGAVVGEVVSEFFGSTVGLGAVITMASSNLQLDQMWGAIFFSALLSLAGIGLVNLAKRLIVRW